MKWINIKDALPPEDGVYLTYTPPHDKHLGKIATYYYSGPVREIYEGKEFYIGYNFYGTPYLEDKFITHWMELPGAPK
jgi:hypothetical protein